MSSESLITVQVLGSARNFSQPPKRNIGGKFHGIFILYSSFNFFVFQGKFSRPPYVLVSSEHTYAERNHDAATVWAENVEVGKFTVCSREMQNFDGLHEDIIVVSEKINITCCL